MRLNSFFFDEIKNSKFLKLKKINLNKVKYISYYHGRELCLKLNKNSWLSIKGAGWNLGPPFYYQIKEKNDPNVFGLLDYYNAKREHIITKYLNKKFKGRFSTSLEIVKINQKLNLSNNFKPALLLRKMTTPYRLTDLILKNKKNALKDLKSFFGGSNKIVFKSFVKKTLTTIVAYHKLGYIHDNIDLGNFNVHGQLLDLELFYIPGIKYPERFYRANANLKNRKEKEAIFYLEVMCKFAEILNLNYSISQIARLCIKYVNINNNKLIFINTIKKISKLY